MRGVIALAVILALLALLIFSGGSAALGLDPTQLGYLVTAIAVGLPAAAWVANSYRGQSSKALESVALWLAIIVALVGGYAFRFEIGEAANRITGAVVPGWTLAARGGEVSVVRAGSSFVLEARVNGAPTRFIFDTGATSVVLTRESAARAGVKLADLAYNVRVSTANGQAMAAQVTLDTVQVGAITLRRVQAMVAAEGALRTDLLGMTFLDRLHSWRVEGDRLILRGPGG